MINFKVKILKYTKETKSFWVEYIPEESMVPPCNPIRQTFILNDLNADSTEDDIYKILSGFAPQQQWQSEIDAENIPTAAVERFESLVDGERSFNVEDLVVPDTLDTANNIISSDQAAAFRDVEMEAAVQRVLNRLTGERI